MTEPTTTPPAKVAPLERLHIVVATDLSLAAEQSYRYAAALALVLGPPEHTQVTLLTIDEATFEVGVGRLVSAYFESVSAAREAAIKRAVDAFEAWGLKATSARRGGTPFRTISAFAIEEDADLVVLARHRRVSPLPRRILGSTVKRLLPVATVPVLVVPVDDTAGAGPGAAVPLPRLSSAVAPTDLSEAAGEALGRTSHLMSRIGGSVTALHVVEQPMWAQVVAGATLPPLPVGVMKQTKEEALNALSGQISRYVGEALASVTPSIVEGFSAESICAVAAQTGADLIALAGTGKGMAERFMLGSVAERVVRTSKVPVLMWPSGSREPRLGAA